MNKLILIASLLGTMTIGNSFADCQKTLNNGEEYTFKYSNINVCINAPSNVTCTVTRFNPTDISRLLITTTKPAKWYKEEITGITSQQTGRTSQQIFIENNNGEVVLNYKGNENTGDHPFTLQCVW